MTTTPSSSPPLPPPPPPFDITTPIGILDPDGLRDNPLTGRPYANVYQDSDKDHKTYTDFAKGWRNLSVYARRDELMAKMQKHQIVCALSGTGSGKTVLFPKYALHVGGYKKKVLCAIPKKVITLDSAKYAAMTLDVKMGQEVGCKYRGSDKRNYNAKRTMLTFATTGTVATMLQNDPLLPDYSYIVIDEAHERSMAMDKLLSLVKELVQRRKDIKIIIMSATIHLDDYLAFFPAPAFDSIGVNVEGSSPFPKPFRWLPAPLQNATVSKAIHEAIIQQITAIMRKPPLTYDRALRASIVRDIRRSPALVNQLNGGDPESLISDGDILAFVPSAGSYKVICDALDATRRKEGWPPFFCTRLESASEHRVARQANGKIITHDVHGEPVSINGKLPTEKDYATEEILYRTHPDSDPNHPFQRKVVIATDVAESSITIKGATYVIDSAVAMSSTFHPQHQLTELQAHRVAKDAIQQRRGRVGRTSPGVVYHLYTEDEFNTFDDITTPDFRKSDIGADVLGILSMTGKDSVAKVRDFYNEMIEPPKPVFLRSACYTLQEMSALTRTQDPLTGERLPDQDTRTILGRAMSFFRAPFTPAQAKSLILSEFYQCSWEMAQIMAMVQACKGKSIVELLMQKDLKSKPPKPYPIPTVFVSQYGDHLTLLHLYQRYHKCADQETFCKTHRMVPKFFDDVEVMTKRIHDTLREKVFENEDQALKTITDEDVIGQDAMEAMHQNKPKPKRHTTGRPQHTRPTRPTRPTRKQGGGYGGKGCHTQRRTRYRYHSRHHPHHPHQGGTFALRPDYTLDPDLTNPSGERDLKVLYALFPQAKSSVPDVLREMAQTSDASSSSASPSSSSTPLSSLYRTPQHAQDRMSERIREFSTPVFRALTLDQQRVVLRALDTTIAHRTKEHERIRQQVKNDPTANRVDADAEAAGHEKWLAQLKAFRTKVKHVVHQGRKAAHTEQQIRQLKVKEVLRKHYLRDEPTTYPHHDWTNVEFRVMRALVEGYLTQCAVQVGKKSGVVQYVTPSPEKPSYASIAEQSTLTPTYWKHKGHLEQFDVVLYETLFKNPRGDVTLQNVSVLPSRVRYDAGVEQMLRDCAGSYLDKGRGQGKSRSSGKKSTAKPKQAFRYGALRKTAVIRNTPQPPPQRRPKGRRSFHKNNRNNNKTRHNKNRTALPRVSRNRGPRSRQRTTQKSQTRRQSRQTRQ